MSKPDETDDLLTVLYGINDEATAAVFATLDEQRAALKVEHLLRVLRAHDLPCKDPDSAMALLHLATFRMVQQFGPGALGQTIKILVEAWRRNEAQLLIRKIAQSRAGRDALSRTADRMAPGEQMH